MATIPPDPSNPDPAAAQQSRLTKDERRELLARIERDSSRTESAERVLQRAEQAFQDGNRTQAERLVAELEQKAPGLLGLGHLRSQLDVAKKQEKQRGNVRKAEEMLLRYIEERKKTAAEFALEALTEIAPEHPKLEEYKIWVSDLDKEAAEQNKLAGEFAAGRLALQVGDLTVAQRHLDQIIALDSESRLAAQLRDEISQAAAGQAENADIEEIKLRFEEHLVALRVAEAEAELKLLAEHEVPKITLDRLGVRLEEARAQCRDEQEIAAFEQLFSEYVRSSLWQKARDVAQQAGQRFTQHPRPAEMFNEVNLREAEHRHKESVRQGITALDQFISQGNRDSAQLALKLLKGKIEDQLFVAYEQRVLAL